MTEVPVSSSSLNLQRGSSQRVLLLGATGTIGRATARALLKRGHHVVCLVRPRQGKNGLDPDLSAQLAGATIRWGDACDPTSLRDDGFAGENFDAIVSCMASRTGTPKDAWRVDYQAHVDALEAAKLAGVHQFVQLSAICCLLYTSPSPRD